MRKPRRDELVDSDRYQPVEVSVTCYRDLETGNLYFVADDEPVVLDKYIQVVDHGGIPIVQRRRAKHEKFLKLIKRAIGVFDPTRREIPLGIAKKLLDLSEGEVDRVRTILDALDLFDGDEPRKAALLLADRFGAPKLHEALEAWFDNPREMAREEFRRLLEEKLEIELPD